ncbi:MAG: alpha-D-glucose phosphate-specific phosphoglucomutase [Deltaproteobacteria bacterium]|nr:alpha-D-glucose phosphate-specific phosphoglucomutase [Deltaproteobacteria bacterium]RLB95100.1 MAG: phosphoglucomutase, alpha-D-glucose phosphate-specific [Deltaproteobacteria bacterium]
MAIHPNAGQPAPPALRANIPRLVTAYYTRRPDPEDPSQGVVFGTSGHRGSSLKGSFNEYHILAITRAICEQRRAAGVDGPLFIGMDTHALSEPAFATALEVLAAESVTVMIPADMGYTPTPAVSHAILSYNRGRRSGLADGIVITPSHNPPEDGGFKYNPPHGGPAGTKITAAIAERANALLAEGAGRIARWSLERALAADTTRRYDYIGAYTADLAAVVDLEAVAAAGLKLGADPLGGAAVAYWEPIAERYGLSIEVVNPLVDPTFGFMPLDRDGKIRMDCSSPCAMRGLIDLKDRFDVAFGNDTDADRHGIVTRAGGLLNPNHFLAVAVWYLFQHRPNWPASAGVGKTLVSSAIIDRIAADLNRPLVEVPVGFKWFVDGLLNGKLGFGGEESAGAAFLRRDGTVWTTDKDGIIMDLLAAEIMARTGKDPFDLYAQIESRFGRSVYRRIDAPASAAQRAVFAGLSAGSITATTLAGDPIVAVQTRAAGNGAPIGGLKVATANGWFAARPSGTEDIYKIYAESFVGEEHLSRLQEEARAMVDNAFKAAGV